MRILFVVNDVDTEVDRATSTVLATAAARRGHDVYLLGVGELEYHEDGGVGGLARRGPGAEVETQQAFLDAVQGKDAPRERVTTEGLDVIWLRYNPAEEVGERAWAQNAGILFGQVALEHGVVVLNHPYSLSWAISKMYFQQFPEAVRPACIITRDDKVAPYIEKICQRDPYTYDFSPISGGMVTVRDSNWFLNWNIERNPHFRDAPEDRIVSARRKALMLRFSRCAAFRLQDRNDPERIQVPL